MIYKTTGFTPRAENISTNLENSYLFASPLQAKADNQEKIRVTVFILNGKGVGINNQTISLKASPYIKIESIQSSTDSYGKAVFDLSSATTGQFTITAQSMNQDLPQKLKVTFY